MIIVSFGLATLFFFLLLFNKWKIDQKLSIPWSIFMAILGSVILLFLNRASSDDQNIFINTFAALVIPIFLTVLTIIYLFFRDPDRASPKDKNLILSPADGKIIYIKEISNGDFPIAIKGKKRIPLDQFTGNDFFLDRGIQVGIAMSFVHVHVNRAPIAGRIVKIKRVAGKFHSLKNLSSLLENERVFTQIDSEDIKIGIVQIASRLVRRIESYLKEQDYVKSGDRIGIIKFGSQVDMIIPHKDNLKVKVIIGNEVKAGLSIIATY